MKGYHDLALRLPVFVRKTHKWLGLFIGIQILLWSLSGLYMTVVHIDTIHGDQLVRPEPDRTVTAASLADPVALASSRDTHSVRLAWLRDQPIYVASSENGDEAFDARTGQPAAAPDEAIIRELASSYYSGSEPIASAALITSIPGEIRGRKSPLWRVEFDHWNKPTFYLSPVTGELVSKRHELWRVFDFVWMLHIMDYAERENVNNMLLRIFTLCAVMMALSGVWLLTYAFPKRKKKKKAVRT